MGTSGSATVATDRTRNYNFQALPGEPEDGKRRQMQRSYCVDWVKPSSELHRHAVLKPETVWLLYTPETESVKDCLERVMRSSFKIEERRISDCTSPVKVRDTERGWPVLSAADSHFHYSGGTKVMAAHARMAFGSVTTVADMRRILTRAQVCSSSMTVVQSICQTPAWALTWRPFCTCMISNLRLRVPKGCTADLGEWGGQEEGRTRPAWSSGWRHKTVRRCFMRTFTAIA